MNVRFFPSAAAFRKWLAANHSSATELWVGFHRKGHGPASSLAYPDAVDEALCFGWIDGVRKRLDETSYVNRFSPRPARSIWSLINLKRFETLKADGRIAPPGQAAFDARDAKRSGLYSFENRPKTLGAANERLFKANQKAWTYFRAQPPGYQRLATWWVMSAAKDETRERRLGQLIELCAAERRLDDATRATKRKA